MNARTKALELELREAFADTLGNSNSYAGISILYHHDKQIRIEVGIPYDIVGEALVIGPYIKSIILSMPHDYRSRMKSIPISDIVRFKRIELSSLF